MHEASKLCGYNNGNVYIYNEKLLSFGINISQTYRFMYKAVLTFVGI